MTEHELDTLLRDYGGAVRSVCRAILPGHPQDAEEAEADTFYKLWRGAHLPADETGSFFCAGTCMARPRPSWAYISTCLPQRCAPGCTVQGWHCKSY